MDLQILISTLKAQHFLEAAAHTPSVLGGSSRNTGVMGNTLGTLWLPERFAVCCCLNRGRVEHIMC